MNDSNEAARRSPLPQSLLQLMGQTPEPTRAPTASLSKVPLSALALDNPLQTRAPFDPEHDEADQALMASLSAGGQRLPVLLAVSGSGYTVLDGHRRVQALRQLGHTTVLAVIVQPDSRDCDLITLTANVRKNLSPLEQARAVGRLRERHGYTHDQIARLVGLSTRYLTELRALLEIDPALQAAVESGALKAGAALVLNDLDPAVRPSVAQLAAEGNWREPEARRLIERVKAGRQTVVEAAQALGLWSPVQPVKGGPESGETREAASPAQQGVPRRKAQASASSLLDSHFPELAAADQELLASQELPAHILKLAGLLIVSGLTSTESLSTARRIQANPAARKIANALDCIADLRALLARRRGVRECAPLLAGLIKQLAGLKAVARMGKGSPNHDGSKPPKKKSVVRDGTPA